MRDVLWEAQVTHKETVLQEGQRRPHDEGQEQIDVHRVAFALKTSAQARQHEKESHNYVLQSF